jgi:predicted RNA-binding protein with RPS1 domain
MSTQRDHVDPFLEEIPITSSGEEVDPKVLDLAMKIAEKMFLKMKEEDAKKRPKKKNQEERPKKIKVRENLITMTI